MKRLMLILIGGLLMLTSMLIDLAIYLKNPDMTTTRLLLTYWKVYLFQIPIEIFGLILVMKGMEE